VVSPSLRVENLVPWRRRTRARLVLLDRHLNVVAAEPEGLELLSPYVVTNPSGQAHLSLALPALAHAIEGARCGDDVVVEFARLWVHVRAIESDQGQRFALFVERSACREDLAGIDRRYGLTCREVEVLRALLQGYSAKEIAAMLGITRHTVIDHFKHLSRKMDARNRTDMVTKALGWRAAAP
jgi:DNA-binding NarL/FixJ family response regulator